MGKKKASMANERSSILLLPPPTACNQGFFSYLFGEFSQPGDQKKRAGESNKGIFEIFIKKCAIS
jgi:hypothetical protein